MKSVCLQWQTGTHLRETFTFSGCRNQVTVRSESHFPHQLGQSPSVLLMRIKPPDPQPCTYFISCHWNRGAHAPDPGLAVGENNLPRKELSKNSSWLQTNTKIFKRNDLAKKLCLKNSKMILYFIKSRIFQIKLT